MRQLKPPYINDTILFEVYFAKFFPVEEFIAKKVMRRTKYGITLTREFKDLLTRKMKHLNTSNTLYEKFADKKYAGIPLEKLWPSIVAATCHIHDCAYQYADGKIFVPEEHADQIERWASAVYIWFSHVQKIQQKTREKKTETKGTYV